MKLVLSEKSYGDVVVVHGVSCYLAAVLVRKCRPYHLIGGKAMRAARDIDQMLLWWGFLRSRCRTHAPGKLRSVAHRLLSGDIRAADQDTKEVTMHVSDGELAKTEG